MILPNVFEALNALRTLEAAKNDGQTDYRNVDDLLKSNPLLAALMDHVTKSVYSKVMEEIDRRMIPPERDLLTIEDVADMIDRSVGAVRKFRERGMLTPIPHRIKGKLMFTKDAVAALATHLEVRANVPIERRSEATTPLTVHLHYTDEHHAEEVAVPTDFRSERGAFRPRT